jgi:hypothetical protein
MSANMLVRAQRWLVGRPAELRSTVRRSLAALVLAWLASSLIACGTPSVTLAEGPREYTASDYERVLSRWTRTEDLITLSALDNILTVTATFESWDFRWAYTTRYARDYQLSDDQGRTMRDEALNEARAHHQFFVAIYGGTRKYTDFNTPQSAWTVRMFDDRGNQTAPEAIVAIAKPGPIERTYFPYASVWRKAFRIKFAVSTPAGPSIAPDANVVGLRFTGPLGSEELRWALVR